MKDTSKAQWPEGMAVQAWSDDATVIGTEDFKDVAEVYWTRGEMKFRAAQICALPEMVALLKEGARDSFTVGRDDTEHQTEFAKKCAALLKKIGEAE